MAIGSISLTFSARPHDITVTPFFLLTSPLTGEELKGEGELVAYLFFRFFLAGFVFFRPKSVNLFFSAALVREGDLAFFPANGFLFAGALAFFLAGRFLAEGLCFTGAALRLIKKRLPAAGLALLLTVNFLFTGALTFFLTASLFLAAGLAVLLTDNRAFVRGFLSAGFRFLGGLPPASSLIFSSSLVAFISSALSFLSFSRVSLISELLLISMIF